MCYGFCLTVSGTLVTAVLQAWALAEQINVIVHG